MAVAVAANTLADHVYYFAARARGRAWLEKRYGSHPRYVRLEEGIGRHGHWLLLGSRFAYGLRILIPAACGGLGMPYRVFGPPDVAAGFVWAAVVAGLGYTAGHALSLVLVDLQRYELWIAVGLVACVAVALSARRVKELFVRRDLRWSDLHAVVPLLVALLGALNLVSAVVTRSPHLLTEIETWLPLEVTQRSRAIMLFAGIALVQVSRNLSRRKRLAWFVASVALLVSLLLHLTRGFDWHHSLLAAVLLVYLFVFRRRFNAASDPASLRQALLMAPLLATAVVVYGTWGLSTKRSEFAWDWENIPVAEAVRSGLLIIDPGVDPLTERAAFFLGSLQIAGWLARFYLLALVLRPVILRRRQEAPPETVKDLIAAHGLRSLSAFASDEDKNHTLLCGGQALAAFAVRGSTAFCLGDPLAAPEDARAALDEFLAYCQRHGWTPCLYEAAEGLLPTYDARGMRSLKIAEEAIVDLSDFSLAGGKRAALRAMVNKVSKLGLRVEAYRRGSAQSDAMDEALEEISEEWLAAKRLAEMGFSVGRFSLETLDRQKVFVVVHGEEVLGFTSWRPYAGGRGAVLDLMRKREGATSGTMDLGVAQALISLKDEGFGEASLANAPLANVGAPRGRLDKGVALLFERLNSFYGYKNLFQFKKKFAPRWEGRYLVYPRNADLPRIVLALTKVHTSGGLWALLRSNLGR